MKKEFNIGDEVWFIDQYGNLCHGIVENKKDGYSNIIIHPDGRVATNWR